MPSVGLAINGLAWLVRMAIFRALSRIWKERSMPRYPKAFRAAYFLIGLACLANAGCLAALVGAGAAAGGAGGYAYYKGNVCQSYPAAHDDAWFAAHAALADLGMPIVEENQAKGVIVSKTGDGDKVHVQVQALANRVPADGPATRVGVRVAF